MHKSGVKEDIVSPPPPLQTHLDNLLARKYKTFRRQKKKSCRRKILQIDKKILYDVNISISERLKT